MMVIVNFRQENRRVKNRTYYSNPTSAKHTTNQLYIFSWINALIYLDSNLFHCSSILNSIQGARGQKEKEKGASSHDYNFRDWVSCLQVAIWLKNMKKRRYFPKPPNLTQSYAGVFRIDSVYILGRRHFLHFFFETTAWFSKTFGEN